MLWQRRLLFYVRFRLADKSEKQLSGETERMREVIKKLLGL